MIIRNINASEYDQLIKKVSESFGYAAYEKIDRDFPHLFAASNFSHLWVACEGDSILGHAGAWKTSLRVEKNIWDVGGIGGVFTLPEARGEGIASNLVNKACEDLKAQGAILAFLWSGKHDYYRKLGFEAIGRQWSIEIPHDQSADALAKNKTWKLESSKSTMLLQKSFELLNQQAWGVARSYELHSQLLGSEGCQVYSAWNGESLLAYAVVNKGRDLSDHIHEWGGEAGVVLELCIALARKIGRPHILLTPELGTDGNTVIALTDKAGFARAPGIMALVKVLQPKVLVEKINEFLNTDGLKTSLIYSASGEAPRYRVSDDGGAHELNELEFLQFAFGSPGASNADIPIRLWWWGMESV